MLLGGLWHGAAWTFVIWGGLHGIYLAVHKIIIKDKKIDIDKWGNGSLGYFGDFLRIFLTFHLVCFTWVFFRASSLDLSIKYVWGIFVNTGELTLLKPVIISILITILIDIGQRYSEDYLWLSRMPIYWRYSVAGSLIMASILVFGYHYSSPTPFIYFQF